jgi:hypothetical protein
MMRSAIVLRRWQSNHEGSIVQKSLPNLKSGPKRLRDAGQGLLRLLGSGILEYDQRTGRGDGCDNADRENKIVLFKDQGLIHKIVTSVPYVDNNLWTATYFGARLFGARYWHK